MALPATLLKIADVIDNPWLIAADRSRRAGVGMSIFAYYLVLKAQLADYHSKQSWRIS